MLGSLDGLGVIDLTDKGFQEHVRKQNRELCQAFRSWHRKQHCESTMERSCADVGRYLHCRETPHHEWKQYSCKLRFGFRSWKLSFSRPRYFGIALTNTFLFNKRLAKLERFGMCGTETQRSKQTAEPLGLNCKGTIAHWVTPRQNDLVVLLCQSFWWQNQMQNIWQAECKRSVPKGDERHSLSKIGTLVLIWSQYALAPVVQEKEERVRFAGANLGGKTNKK